MRTKVTAFLMLVILLILGTTPVYSQDEEEVPPLPHALYGTIEINDSPAPVGTTVEARGEGVRISIAGNPIATDAVGNYGSPDPMETKLVIQGHILDGTPITFYVNGVSTEQTVEWHSGEVTELTLSATITVPPGGGGGGGGAPPALPPGIINLRELIDRNGVFTQNVIALSFDSLCRLIIDKGTTGLTDYGQPLSEINMILMVPRPAPPEGAHIIGFVYDLQPDGATFNPPATLEYTYDPAKIPEGVSEENLVFAWWDAEAGKWVELESTVNTEANTISAPVSHFSAFCALSYTRPAAFTTADLTISPVEVAINESVTISILVTNTGDLTDSYEVTLKINDEVEASKEVTVNGSASEKVTFTVAKDRAGSYSVDVNGLSGSFSVNEKPAPVPAPSPAPAEPPTPAPTPGFDWSVILGITGGIAAVVMIIFLVIRERKGERVK